MIRYRATLGKFSPPSAHDENDSNNREEKAKNEYDNSHLEEDDNPKENSKGNSKNGGQTRYENQTGIEYRLRSHCF